MNEETNKRYGKTIPIAKILEDMNISKSEGTDTGMEEIKITTTKEIIDIYEHLFELLNKFTILYTQTPSFINDFDDWYFAQKAALAKNIKSIDSGTMTIEQIHTLLDVLITQRNDFEFAYLEIKEELQNIMELLHSFEELKTCRDKFDSFCIMFDKIYNDTEHDIFEKYEIYLK